jgi:hypothetical protein
MTVIAQGREEAGLHRRSVDLSALPSGTYFVELRINGVPTVQRIELMR